MDLTKSMTQAKTDCEELLTAVMPFVEQQLKTHGTFPPVGASMDETGKIALAAGYDDMPEPSAPDLINLIKDGFRAAAAAGSFKATALFYDSLAVPPGKTEKSDAIAVMLDHRDNLSVIVFFPYRMRDSQLTLEPSFVNSGKGEIFVSK